jgi:hypothetical protein
MSAHRHRTGSRGLRHRVRGTAAVALLAVIGIGLAACTGIPTTSPAYDVTQVADQIDPAAPEAPQSGQQPDQIVRGFIAATARTDLDVAAGSSFAAARQYLTPDAQTSWQPVGLPVVVLADAYRTVVDTANAKTVTVTGTTVGTLDAERAFHSEAAVAYSRVLNLEQVDGQWRISDPPPELMLTQSDFATAFRQRVLYFLDATGTVVVPDVRHVVIGQTPANRANRLISLLISGPSTTLRGAVTTQFSANSALRSNPTVDPDGVLRIDLTGVDISTPEARRALAAQIVWTLSPTSPRIAVTVDGQPLDPAQEIFTINSVSSFDPDRLAGTGQVASDAYFVDTRGAIEGLTNQQPVAGEMGTGSPPVSGAAMSAATGALAAVAADPTGGSVLMMAQPGVSGTAAPLLKAGTLTTPSFTRTGEQAWVVQNGMSQKPEAYQVSTTGEASRERVGSSSLTGLGAVTALALSPDGVRVAVVAGDKLYLGVIAPAPAEEPSTAAPTAGAPTSPPTSPTPPATDSVAAVPEPESGQSPLVVTNLSVLRPDLLRVGAVTFANSRELMVAAAATPTSYRTVDAVSIDGFESRSITDRGIFGDVDGIAVAQGEPMLITFGGRVWQLEGTQTDGQWQSPLPDQPFLNGSSPFYPR